MLPAVSEDPPSLLMRVVGGLSCLVLGAATGVIGTFAHQSGWTLLGARLPVGLVAALLAVACLVAGLRLALDSRLYAGLAAVGILVAIGVLALPGPSGSALLPANFAGYGWTLGPAVISALVLAWPRGLSRDSGRGPRGWNTDGGEETAQ
ncbi:DUF6113 family protein [Naasia aerilata]|uniref:Histidinol dehydrogenase n=1 Tax=Naasia aerilata TaxID=1162966 RepID=A0ABM8G907_9MICO|nr:DUF6113 family protein [Naasia aerilata]BDZ44599.1 hypothetical protein GCM10025866_05080 [Naasia aerilata]